MRTFIPRHTAIQPSFLRNRALGIETLLAIALFASCVLAAQTPAAPPEPSATHKPAHHRAHSASAHASTARDQAATAPVTPAAPPAPVWPINSHPSPASVVWDSQGLRIEASNSSLQQILHDVATATGAAVEGSVPDQRVFGDFGPGKARDVLSQLLQGTGYNILMVGDQGQGAPRQIVLSSRRGGNPADHTNGGALNNNDDDAAENEVDEPLQPQPVLPATRPGFNQEEPVRTPQQMMQEQQQQPQPQPPQPPDNKPPNN